MLISLIQSPTLYFYHADSGNFIDKCDYLSNFEEKYDNKSYAPYEYQIKLTTQVIDDDLIEIIKNSKDVVMYTVFKGLNADDSKQINVAYLFTGVIIDSVSYSLQDTCELTSFNVNLLALNKIRLSEKEIPSKIYKEMTENE